MKLERRVFQNLWLSILVFVLFVWFQILYSRRSIPECPLTRDEFLELRNASSADASLCPDALARWNLLPRAVASLRRGEFDYSPMKFSLDVTCRAALDVEFLQENAECVTTYQLVSLEPELKAAIKLWNTILPIWFECFYDGDDNACTIIIPSLVQFYRNKAI
jgi:hypothetical protein